MAYLVKDLLVNILPCDDKEATAERLPWWLAGYEGRPTWFHLCAWVGRQTTLLGPTGVLPTGESASMATLLASLKEQVKSALAELDREHSAVARSGRHASDRVEDARAQLKKALDEIARDERTIDERLRPHTLKQVKELEVKLEEALAELKRIGASLE